VSQESSPIIPFLRYRDSTKAVQWLVEAFGFDTFEVNTDGDGNVVHAELRWDNATLQVGPPTEDGAMAMRSPLDLPYTNQGVYLKVGTPEQVDEHYARAVAAGAEVVMELNDTPYGTREYVAKDFEGHIWAFGTYAPKLT
jgi:uncharacterized glyoxalase superfamily protein PhnB